MDSFVQRVQKHSTLVENEVEANKRPRWQLGSKLSLSCSENVFMLSSAKPQLRWNTQPSFQLNIKIIMQGA